MNIKELSLPVLAFQQDFSDNEPNNNEIKLIEMNNENISDFLELQKHQEFKKRLNRTEFEII